MPSHSVSKSYSHSIVPGRLLVTSYTTRFTPFASFMMRVTVSPKHFMSNWWKSAVIAVGGSDGAQAHDEVKGAAVARDAHRLHREQYAYGGSI